MIHDLIVCTKARIPVIWFVTHEELRAEQAIQRYILGREGQVWVWSLTSNDGERGWQTPEGQKNTKAPFEENEATDPTMAVASVIKFAQKEEHRTEELAIIIRDPHHFIREDASFCRILRDASFRLKGTKTSIICISPEEKLPIELQKDVKIVFAGLPPEGVLRKVVDEQLNRMKEALHKEYDEAFRDRLARACCGMTLNQASDAISQSVVKNKREIDIDYVNRVKTEALSSLPGLTYIGKAPSLEDSGGLAGIKEFLLSRRDGFSQEARDFGLPIPRGALFIGITGCGKSLLAKATASTLGLPLLKLTIPNLKGGIVGETERNWRICKQAIEVNGQSVVWIDELEKSIQGAGERNSDGGTSSALLQGILEFLQEREGGSFFVATANEIDRLPPELFRKGRFDAIFFVDLPNEEERREIINIHVRKIGRELSPEDLERVIDATENRTGAEIEAGIIEGLWRTWHDGRRKVLTAEDIISCLEMDPPIAVTMRERISGLRSWAETRARSASKTFKTSLKKKEKAGSFSFEVVEDSNE